MINTTTLEVGQMLSVDGEAVAISAIKGRWVKLDTGNSISRGEAIAYRADFLEEHADDDEDTDIDGEYSDDLDENGNVIPLDDEDDQTDADADAEEGYAGPMLRLRERLAEGAYSKAVNGNPCCGDMVAIKLGTLKPAQVIRACLIAMNLPVNPYTHLNIGQQSMNLRNKLRGCLKREEFGFGVVAEAVEQIMEEDQVL